MSGFIEIQHQIKQNSAEISEFLKELQSWESEIGQKDSKLKDGHLILTIDRSAGKQVHIDLGLSSDEYEEYSKERKEGNEEYDKGNFTSAVNHYNRCISIAPKDPVALGNRAMAYIKLKKFEEAEADCTAALTLDPTNLKVLFRRAAARVQQLPQTQTPLQTSSSQTSASSSSKSSSSEVGRPLRGKALATLKAAMEDARAMLKLDASNKLARSMLRDLEARLPAPIPTGPTARRKLVPVEY